MDQGPPHKTRYTETSRLDCGEKPQKLGTGENFLNRTTMAYALRSRIDKWDLIKLQRFCEAKDTVIRTKQQPTEWEKIFSNPRSDRGIISNIYKKLKKLDSRESHNLIQIGIQS